MIVFTQIRWRRCGITEDRLCLFWAVERFRDLMIVFAQNKMAAMWNDSRSSLLLLSCWEVAWPHDRLCSKQDGGQAASSAAGQCKEYPSGATMDTGEAFNYFCIMWTSLIIQIIFFCKNTLQWVIQSIGEMLWLEWEINTEVNFSIFNNDLNLAKISVQ